jgi:1-deoxy-D-xylulose-5-phosphate synthase
MYAAAGLDADGIVKAVFTALGKNDVGKNAKTGAAQRA